VTSTSVHATDQTRMEKYLNSRSEHLIALNNISKQDQSMVKLLAMCPSILPAGECGCKPLGANHSLKRPNDEFYSQARKGQTNFTNS
jgi:hypothetical protein